MESTRATRWPVKICQNSSKRTYMMNIVSMTKTPEKRIRSPRSATRKGNVYERQRKELKCGTVESNALLDVCMYVPIVMPEHADGSRESKETDDTAEVKLDDCQTNGSGRSEAEWDLDVAVYPPPGKRVFDGARERRLGSATTARKY